MNSTLEYVRWVKQKFPLVYQAAVAKVQRKNALGGLGDDLVSDISFDPNTVSASDTIDYTTVGAANPSGASSSTDWSGIIDSVARAIPAVAGSVVNSKAAWDLINVNAANAQRGLPMQTSLLHPNASSTTFGYGVIFLGGLALLAFGMRGRRK